MEKKKPVSNKLKNNYKFKTKKEGLWQIAAGKLGFSETE